MNMPLAWLINLDFAASGVTAGAVDDGRSRVIYGGKTGR